VDLVVGASKNSEGDGVDPIARGAFYVLFMDGISRIDFEGEVNGQEIGGGTNLSGGVSIEGFPAGSGLTAAVFDSCPTGPNQLGGDPDLLVDSGNVLILQGIAGQTTPGIYDQPDDERRGGEFLVHFGGSEVRLCSIDLVDFCPQPGQNGSVTLIDDSGLTRTYDIPEGWTEDVSMDGPPGIRRLDLTTLTDQPGFASTATASEEPNFDDGAVVLMEIHLGGSGAIDNIEYDATPDDLQASQEMDIDAGRIPPTTSGMPGRSRPGRGSPRDSS
jgi:hypothetical protein